MKFALVFIWFRFVEANRAEKKKRIDSKRRFDFCSFRERSGSSTDHDGDPRSRRKRTFRIVEQSWWQQQRNSSEHGYFRFSDRDAVRKKAKEMSKWTVQLVSFLSSFPQVKAAPQTRENSSKQSSRPRTSVPQKTPQNQVQLESSKKTVVTSPVQARSIDEKKESTPIRKSVSDRPLISSLSQVNRDVQVLTIDDDDKVETNAQIQAKDQVPF